MEALKRLVSQVPYTLLCFAGVSGVTLKVVVRLPDGFRPDALTDAQANAISIYEALSGGRVVPAVPSLMAGCRMSYDANLFYNPGAQPLPVVLRGDAAAEAYGGAVADDDGAVGYPAEAEQQQRMKMELQTCLQKPFRKARTIWTIVCSCWPTIVPRRICSKKDACAALSGWRASASRVKTS